MKYFIALVFFTVQLQFSYAQEDIELKFDHESLLVSDMQKSADFYHNILQLEELKNPLNSPDRKWFSLGGNYQLHLIREDRKVVQTDVATHFALSVKDLNAFMEYLDKKNVPYTNWPTTEKALSVRPDNVKQVYVKDPDGYWIEINDATY